MAFIQNEKKEQIVIIGEAVSVMAVFNPLGDVKPLYISLVDLYGNVCKVKVEGIKYKKDIRGGISFCCTYKSGDVLREVVINFYFKEHIWTLPNY